MTPALQITSVHTRRQCPPFVGQFITKVKAGLMSAGFDATKFSGHSLCRGAASSAAAAGFSNYEIQQLG